MSVRLVGRKGSKGALLVVVHGDESDRAIITIACLEEVREGLAAMASS
jgi:hypothetical protein